MIVRVTEPDKPTVTVEIPDEHDWTVVAEKCRALIFPSAQALVVDRKFNAVMERRKKEHEQRAEAEKAEQVRASAGGGKPQRIQDRAVAPSIEGI